MRITVETGEKTIVFNDVSDAYVAVRQAKPYDTGTELVKAVETSSFSWGGALRELVKEVQQSLVEMQDVLKESRHGGTS